MQAFGNFIFNMREKVDNLYLCIKLCIDISKIDTYHNVS